MDSPDVAKQRGRRMFATIRPICRVGSPNMPLESLLQLVETLRERINAHRAALSQSEALTRYSLIDPLLREVGWDTEDPSIVVPEYRSGSGSADYALLNNNGNPAMIVEAKKLGTPLRDQVLAQGINYCLMEGTNHFAVTDGASWEIYETHRPVPIDQKRVVEFDLSEPSAAETCLRALALWRPSVQSGHVVNGQVPVIELTSDRAHAGDFTDMAPQSDTSIPSEHEWQSLSGLNPAKGDPAPAGIMFPDKSHVDIARWGGTVGEVVRWLVKNRLLEPHHCPIPSPRNDRQPRSIVHTEPIHPDGRRFGPHYQVGSLYVLRTGQARPFVQRAIAVIRHVDQDPSQFKVRFA